MIEKIKIKTGNPRFEDCDFKEFTFKPGLNIIVGPNGSGKSSLLDIIKSFECLSNSFGENKQILPNNRIRKDLLKQEAEIEGCLCKTLEYSPQEYKESNGGEYLGSFINYMRSKFQSNGEGRIIYHQYFVENVQKNHSFTESELEFLSKEKDLKYSKDLLIIADEPENSMSIEAQIEMIEWFEKWCAACPTTLQVIIATHSIAAYMLNKNEKINLIETKKDWIQKIKEKLKSLL